MTTTSLMILADKRFKILKLKGEWNTHSQSEEPILSLQAEKHNLKNRTIRRDHIQNESKTKKKQGKNSKEKPNWMKTNIHPKDSEFRISTYNDTAWHCCIKETGGKCLVNWRVHKPSKYRGNSTNNTTRGDKGSYIQKILNLSKAMETLIKSSYVSDSDGYNYWSEIQRKRIRQLHQKVRSRNIVVPLKESCNGWLG